MRSPLARVGLVLLGAAVGVSACSTTSGTSERPPSAAVAPTSTVSAQEYRAAVQSLLDCMAAQNYDVEGPVLSPFDGKLLLRHVYPPKDKQDPKIFNSRLERCEDASRLAVVEPVFMENPDRAMDKRLIPDARRCLEKQGVRARGDEKLFNEYLALASDTADYQNCVTSAAQEKIPGLPPVITIFS